MYYGEDDGNQEKPRSRYLDLGARFERRTTEIRNRNATHLTVTFRGCKSMIVKLDIIPGRICPRL
jgi:hypothetical protein